MVLTRRQSVVGLAALLGGGGLITATGAFDTVVAEREVRVQFDADSAAVLTMVPNPERFGDGADDTVSDSVNIFEEDGEITIELVSVNRNARVTYTDLVQFTNNGTRDLASLSFSMDDDSDPDHGTLAVIDEENILDDNLAPGESVVGLGLVVNTLSEARAGALPSSTNEIDISGTVTISAEAV